MISRRSAIGIALAAVLSGCATATPYRPATPGNPAAGGFSESRLQHDRYRVTFIGNSLTSRKRAERYLLYRAAELTVQHGYDWFEAADQRTEARPQTIVDPDPFMRPDFMWGGDNGFRRPSWRQSSPRWGGGWRGWDPFWGESYFGNRTQVRTVDRFEVTTEIVLRKGAKPAGGERAHDAREVLSKLGPEVRRTP